MPVSNYLVMLTVADWNLLMNALIAALMIIYGLWIRDIVKQQEKLKDVTIQALHAALTAKEAEISRLTSDTAPNIVKAYQGMREHADKMTADVMKLQEKLEKAQALTETRDMPAEEFAKSREALAEAKGLRRGFRILMEQFEKYKPPSNESPTPLESWESITEAMTAILNECEISIKKAEEILDNPSLPKLP